MRLSWLTHPRNLIVYGVLVTATILMIHYKLTSWIVGLVLVALLVVYYFVLPAIAMRGLSRFDGELRKLLVKGDPDKLLAFYKSHLMLRAFAPPGLMKHRLGQIHAARRVWSLAFQAYHEALRSERVDDRYPLLLGYAEAGFHAGEDEAIRPALVKLVKDPRAMSTTAFMLIHVMISGQGKPKSIRKILGVWKDRAVSDGERAVMGLAEAELLALEGRREAAMKRLARIEVQSLPEPLRSLATLLEAKIHHVEGRKNKARALFDEVRQAPAGGRARIELREFLE